MGDLLLILIPLALGAALQPPQIIALILLLQTRRGTANGVAYVGGMTLFHIILGAVFWLMITSIESSVESEGGQFGLVVGAILFVMGLLLLVHALRRSFSARSDDDAAVGWLEKGRTLTSLRAGLLGMAFLALDPKDWLFGLTAVQAIAAADLSNSTSLFAYLAYILMVQFLLLILLLIPILFPHRASVWLGTINSWIERHVRAIDITVSTLLGLYLLITGLEYLGLF